MKIQDKAKKSIPDIVKGMNAAEIGRCIQLYDDLLKSVAEIKTYEAMTNSELAEELMNTFWADLPVLSKNSNLLDVVIARLKGSE